MQSSRIVSEAEWLAARKSLLEKEKAFTRLRDELVSPAVTSLGKS